MSTSKILVSEREICLWFIAARLPVKEISYNEKRPGTETKDSTALTHVLLLFFLSFFLSFLLFWKSKGLEELVSKSTLFPKKLYITVKVVQLFSFGWRCSEEAILLTFTHLTVHFLILFLESEVWKSYQKHL